MKISDNVLDKLRRLKRIDLNTNGMGEVRVRYQEADETRSGTLKQINYWINKEQPDQIQCSLLPDGATSWIVKPMEELEPEHPGALGDLETLEFNIMMVTFDFRMNNTEPPYIPYQTLIGTIGAQI